MSASEISQIIKNMEPDDFIFKKPYPIEFENYNLKRKCNTTVIEPDAGVKKTKVSGLII